MAKAKEIPLEKLEEDPMNIRSKADIDEAFMNSLKKGQIEPIVVRPKARGDKYLVTVGSRRFAAARRAKLDKLECKIREDLEGKDYEAMQLSARENAGSEEVPSRDWRNAVKRALKEEGGAKDEKTVRKIADKLGLSRRTTRDHIETLKLSEDYEWVLKTADGKPPAVVRALRKDPSKRSGAERKAIEEKFQEESKKVPSVTEINNALKPSKGLQAGTMGHRGLAKLARELDRFEKLPFREQVAVVLEIIQEGHSSVQRALKGAEDRESERKRKEREHVSMGHRICFRLNEKAYNLLKDYAKFKRVNVPEQAAENIVLRFLAEEVRGHPMITDIK